MARFYHRRIADWHTGVMCSYELLELIEYAPPEGLFKTALREGELSEDQWALRQIANETAILRAGMVAGTDSEDWGSRLFLPVSKVARDAEAASHGAAARDALFAMIDTGAGD